MKISLNWLKTFVEIPNLSSKELQSFVTLHTAEVEGIEDLTEKFKNMVVGEIISITNHPDADKLKVTQTRVGAETKTIVCGGNNIKEGMKVAVALAGAKVTWHGEGDLVEIKDCKIRGQKSEGMICASEEIGLAEVFKPVDGGIMDLSHLDLKVGTPLAELVGSDSILEIDNKSITHRPDLWGHYGFAREFSAIFNTKLKSINEFLDLPENSSSQEFPVEIKSDSVCPRFSVCTVEGIEIKESPKWLKEKIEAVGLNSINNIVDITNFVMLELGQPMHAYDFGIVNSESLIVRTAKEGEKLILLDESEYKLYEGDAVVCDQKNNILGLAGIKGGLNSGINNETKKIILEAANWDPVVIRKSSQKHGLRTDASQRFEKSLDPLLTETALKRALTLIKQCCPESKISSSLSSYGKWQENNPSLSIDSQRICSKIGCEISEEKIIDILTRLEFKIEKEDKNLKITVPSFRATKDVDIEDDIIEEVARMHGYDNIPAIMPIAHVKLPQENIKRKRTHEARSILAHALGFDEIYTYSYLGQKDITNSLLKVENHVELENYLSEDQSHLRTSLVPNLIKKVVENSRNFEEFKIFDIGNTFIPQEKDLPLQEKHLAAACVLNKKSKEEVFYHAKGAAEEFFKIFSSQKIRFLKTEKTPAYAHPKKSLEILLGKESIGFIFTVHPLVAQNWELENPTAIFEFNLSKLVESKEKVKLYQPIAKFPASNFDISVVVEEKTEIAEIENAIRKVNSTLVSNINLFDIYRNKEKLGENKKALAFKIELQASDRTLSEQETDSFIKTTISELNKIGEVRGS